MKKTLITVLSVALLVCLVFSQAAFAATKSDILTEAKKSPIFHYIEGNVTKLMDQTEVTSEQADKVIAVVKQVNAVVTTDKGGSYINDNGKANYTVAEKEAVLKGIDDICAILNITYTIESVTTGTGSSSSAHSGDMKIVFRNAAGQIILEFDGDLVKDTSSSTAEVSYILIAVSGILVLAAIGAYVYGKKKVLSK